MPPATAWGWNPQLLAAGSAYATYSAEATKVRKAMADRLPLSQAAPGRRQLLLGRRAYAGLEGADPVDFLAVLAVGGFEIVM